MPGSVTPSVRRNIKAASVRLLTSAALVLANAARADEGLRCEVYAVQCHHDYPLGNGGLLGGGGFGNTGFGGHGE
jgi:hypothetical protein